MTCEELKTFAKEVAEPKIAELLANANTPDFLPCIVKMRIEVLDCRSCGKDYHIIANGFTCRDGKVFAETLCDVALEDDEVKEQMEWLRECAFLKEGTVTVWDALEEATLEVKFYNAGKYLSLFPALSFLASTPMWVQSEYLPILEALAEREEKNKAVIEELRSKMQVLEFSLKAGPELHCKCQISARETTTFAFCIGADGNLYCHNTNDPQWHPVRDSVMDVRENDFFLVDQGFGVEIHEAYTDVTLSVVQSAVTNEWFSHHYFRPEVGKVIENLLKSLTD